MCAPLNTSNWMQRMRIIFYFFVGVYRLMPGSDLACFLNHSEAHFSHFLSFTINFAAAPSMLSGSPVFPRLPWTCSPLSFSSQQPLPVLTYWSAVQPYARVSIRKPLLSVCEMGATACCKVWTCAGRAAAFEPLRRPSALASVSVTCCQLPFRSWAWSWYHNCYQLFYSITKSSC